MIDCTWLLLGLLSLCVGTTLTVNAATNIAQQMGVSQFFIGVTIIALGTDLPETAVAISGALSNLRGVDASDLIVGNAIGSCVCQISIVLGMTALFVPLSLTRRELYTSGVALLGSIALLWNVGYDQKVGRDEGFILIGLFLLYYLVVVWQERKGLSWNSKPLTTIVPDGSKFIAGVMIVILASEVVVSHGVALAKFWDLDQSFIGSVMISLGTSLPELALSLGALVKRSISLSVGNIFGSNVFDSLVPIGLSSSVTELSFNQDFLFLELPLLIVLSLVTLLSVCMQRKAQQVSAILLVLGYGGYLYLKSQSI